MAASDLLTCKECVCLGCLHRYQSTCLHKRCTCCDHGIDDDGDGEILSSQQRTSSK